MHSKLFAAAGIAGLMMLAPVSADAACCEQAKQEKKAVAPCCADHTMKPDAPCCADHHKAAAPELVENDMLLQFENDPLVPPPSPSRQLAEVWFQRPVRVGKSILQGRYVIEHDNDRMARGAPLWSPYPSARTRTSHRYRWHYQQSDRRSPWQHCCRSV